MTHITQNGIDSICENIPAPGDRLITIEEALDPDGEFYDCADCHKKLTGRAHSRPS